MTSSTRPVIGVFDSGVGGLTVLRALIERVPHADYLYFGDTARLPYGSKSVQTISKYAISAAQYLQDHGAEYLVVACNTASALALDAITTGVSINVLGVIEPGADAAARASRSRKAIVIATEGTVGSHAYREALARRGIAAEEKACPLFVPLVEEGWTDHEVTERIAHIYLDPQFAGEFGDADTLVLGCTHYPLLKPLLRRVVPANVAIVDSAEATAVAVAQQFTVVPGKVPTVDSAIASSAVVSERFRRNAPDPAPSPTPPPPAAIRFFATDSVEKFRRAGERFLGRTIDGIIHVKIE